MSIGRPVGLPLLLLLLSFAGLPTGALAAPERVFSVSGVAVDVTAETAAAAREQALLEGRGEAIGRLWQRLVPSEHIARIPPLSGAQVADLVQDFSVAGERTSDVRYIASVTVRFRPDGIRQFLRVNGIPFAETPSKPVVILPLYRSAAGTMLWDDPNPWREVWLQGVWDGGLVPLLTPLGDLADVVAIDASRAEDGDRAAIEAIARRYGAEDVLVVRADLLGDATQGLAELGLLSERHGPEGEPRVRLESLRQESGESLGGLLTRGAASVAASVQEEWKRTNVLRFEEQQMLTAQVPLSGLADWVEVRRRLSEVASVLRTDLRSLTRKNAMIEIAYYGETEQLARAVAQRDLRLAEGAVRGPEGPVWELRLSAAAVEVQPQAPAGDSPAETDATTE